MTTFHAIPKIEGGRRNWNAVLFLPDQQVNHGQIACYAHIGQHSSACISYYQHDVRNAKTEAEKDAVRDLVKEYRRLLQPGEELRIVHRDTEAFRRERYDF